MKSKDEYVDIKAALETLISLIHDPEPCACMGPIGDDLLCPCANRAVAKKYLEDLHHLVENELKRQ